MLHGILIMLIVGVSAAFSLQNTDVVNVPFLTRRFEAFLDAVAVVAVLFRVAQEKSSARDRNLCLQKEVYGQQTKKKMLF